jgi:tRNA nucleotidyltransferase (CCA-adding enzyme)
MGPNPKLIDKLFASLPAEQCHALSRTGALAEESGQRAFLVGGPVRDLLLGHVSTDIDVSVEGDAIALATRLSEETGARVVRHAGFGTATVSSGAWRLDLATARAETYARPGALPKVHPAGIDADLLRRDFTINAMALTLNGPAPGKLLDPSGGKSDLNAGLIRVLHDRSFQDDATRMLRAARYEARFGFRLEEATLDLLLRDISYLGAISGTRIRHEFELIFREATAPQAVSRLHDLGVLTAVHPALTWTASQSNALKLLSPPPYGLPVGALPTAWAVLAWETPREHLPSLIARVALTKRQREAVSAVPDLRDTRPRLTDDMRPSAADALLSPFPVTTLLALATIEDTGAGWWAREYLSRLRSLRPLLRGGDLPTLGVPPGKTVGDILARLRAAKLDGEVPTRADEERLVRDYLANHPK